MTSFQAQEHSVFVASKAIVDIAADPGHLFSATQDQIELLWNGAEAALRLHRDVGGTFWETASRVMRTAHSLAAGALPDPKGTAFAWVAPRTEAIAERLGEIESAPAPGP